MAGCLVGKADHGIVIKKRRVYARIEIERLDVLRCLCVRLIVIFEIRGFCIRTERQLNKATVRKSRKLAVGQNRSQGIEDLFVSFIFERAEEILERSRSVAVFCQLVKDQLIALDTAHVSLYQIRLRSRYIGRGHAVRINIALVVKFT